MNQLIMFLLTTLVVCCLLGQISADTTTTCSVTTDCADDECCFHPEVLSLVKRNFQPFDAKTGMCKKLTKTGRSCNIMNSCGCEKPATCQPFTSYGPGGMFAALEKRVPTLAVCRTVLIGRPFDPMMTLGKR